MQTARYWAGLGRHLSFVLKALPRWFFAKARDLQSAFLLMIHDAELLTVQDPIVNIYPFYISPNKQPKVTLAGKERRLQYFHRSDVCSLAHSQFNERNCKETQHAVMLFSCTFGTCVERAARHIEFHNSAKTPSPHAAAPLARARRQAAQKLYQHVSLCSLS